MTRPPDLATVDGDLETSPRPRTRADCQVGGPYQARPCAWISCPHHIAGAEIDESGQLAVAGVILPVEMTDGAVDAATTRAADRIANMRDSCVLDVVDRDPDGATLERVGQTLKVTRERIRQIEIRAFKHGLPEARRVIGDARPTTPGPAALDVRGRLERS